MKHLMSVILIFTVIISSCNVSVKKEKIKKETTSEVPFKLEQAWMTDSVFRTPESVYFDSIRNVCYVSNINRGLEGNKGFISKLSPDGKVLDLHWVDSLSAPKGMGMLAGNMLYVADMTNLVEIDVEKGEITQEFPADGSSMLNDVASDGLGTLYISDSDTSIIYQFKDGILSQWLSEGLNHPNGLYVDSSRLLVASDGDKELKAIDLRTKMTTILTKNIDNGDGITWPGYPGFWLVSNWAGEIFMIYPDYHKVSLLNTMNEKINSADITYVPSNGLLYVPTFFANRIMAYKLIKE